MITRITFGPNGNFTPISFKEWFQKIHGGYKPLILKNSSLYLIGRFDFKGDIKNLIYNLFDLIGGNRMCENMNIEQLLTKLTEELDHGAKLYHIEYLEDLKELL